MGDTKRKKIRFNVFITLVSIVMLVVISNVALTMYGAIVKSNSDGGGYLGEYKPIIIVTGSMLPTIQVNSINIVKKCSIEDINIGDIVMYKHDNGMLITHRAKEFTEFDGQKAVIVKGDNNDSVDVLPVLDGQIRGKIVFTWNAIAPILSDILPQYGALNPMAILRAMLVVLLIIVTSIVTINKVYEISASIYWVSNGNKKYKRKMEEYLEKQSKIAQDIEKVNTEIRDIPENETLLNKIKIGIHRERVLSAVKDMEISQKKIEQLTNLINCKKKD